MEEVGIEQQRAWLPIKANVACSLILGPWGPKQAGPGSTKKPGRGRRTALIHLHRDVAAAESVPVRASEPRNCRPGCHPSSQLGQVDFGDFHPLERAGARLCSSRSSTCSRWLKPWASVPICKMGIEEHQLHSVVVRTGGQPCTASPRLLAQSERQQLLVLPFRRGLEASFPTCLPPPSLSLGSPLHICLLHIT